MGERICGNLENGLGGMKLGGQWGGGWRASWSKLECAGSSAGEIEYGIEASCRFRDD